MNTREQELLFILPNKNNYAILVNKGRFGNQIPVFDKLVNDIGFEDPHSFNQWFFTLTSIVVFRRYVFSYGKYVIFVLEAVNDITDGINGYSWISYDEIIKTLSDKTIIDIVLSVKDNYHKSMNMPWVNENGFSKYLSWVDEVVTKNGYFLTGEISQVKNAYVSNVFCIPTNIGNLYLKIPCAIYIKEMEITRQLMNWNITLLPEWLAYDTNTNAILMKDMGGFNLPDNSDITTLEVIAKKYAMFQRDSINYISEGDFAFYNYSITSIWDSLDLLSQSIYEMLKSTRYELATDELVKLKINVNRAKEQLNIVKQYNIPDTINHGDLRNGNIRVMQNGYIFYDWSWSSISHPFIGISNFLHVIRRTLPPNIHAKDILIESYLEEWKEFNDIDELKKVFYIIDDLKILFMLYEDYCWLTEILRICKNQIDDMSADGWLLERRYYYFSRVL